MTRPYLLGLRAVMATAAIGVTTVLSFGATASAAGSTAVPFTDPAQSGLITLCNQAGQPMTSGSLDATPFVWKAVSSSAAPAGYRKHGLATLFGYQPIQYEAPGDWSGKQLNDASYFDPAAHPVTVSTAADEPLVAFTSAFPAHWSGLEQLRLIYTAKNTPADTTTYPTAVIRITGNTWTMVQGGHTPCNAGKAVSLESIALRKSQITPRHVEPVAQASTGSSSTAATGSNHSQQARSAGVAAAGHGGSTAVTTHNEASQSAASSGTSTAAKEAIGLGIVLVLALLGGGLAVVRRNKAAGAPR